MFMNSMRLPIVYRFVLVQLKVCWTLIFEAEFCFSLQVNYCQHALIEEIFSRPKPRIRRF